MGEKRVKGRKNKWKELNSFDVYSSPATASMESLLYKMRLSGLMLIFVDIFILLSIYTVLRKETGEKNFLDKYSSTFTLGNNISQELLNIAYLLAKII
uniref:Uncharacterized protein n=1 Tax=Heterorhabditis bacteriophora TaxID=37862 RepID=A0A1I7X9Q9_HETBA